ncbi:MAG: PepSY domain-containing protein [Iphinoe sp. HA4291-MV1]|nr:PepSY domain-containing protein [Iphinoe sp. HA4291-MV1]
MKTSTKIVLAAAFVGTLGISGLARVVGTKQPQSPVAIVRQHHSTTQVAEASDGDGETNDDAQEQQEANKLQTLAKITAQQAQQAAETSVGGKASRVKLENENGNLVYAVEIGQQDVKVDAGNDKVLYTENTNQQNENIEATRPKSSIQVQEASDGDGETNDDGH